MEHVTEYSLEVNGKIDPLWPVTRDKETARKDRLTWLGLAPDDVVVIVHRRVVIQSWFPTTN